MLKIRIGKHLLKNLEQHQVNNSDVVSVISIAMLKAKSVDKSISSDLSHAMNRLRKKYLLLNSDTELNERYALHNLPFKEKIIAAITELVEQEETENFTSVIDAITDSFRIEEELLVATKGSLRGKLRLAYKHLTKEN